jgi:CTP:phosphocholine cytidylyltransferase-like protein
MDRHEQEKHNSYMVNLPDVLGFRNIIWMVYVGSEMSTKKQTKQQTEWELDYGEIQYLRDLQTDLEAVDYLLAGIQKMSKQYAEKRRTFWFRFCEQHKIAEEIQHRLMLMSNGCKVRIKEENTEQPDFEKAVK